MVKAYKISAVLADQGTVATASDIKVNGKFLGFAITTPNLSSTNTTTFAIVDAYGVTVYSKASIAESLTNSLTVIDANNHPLRVPLVGPVTVTMTASGTQTGAVTYTAVIYYEAY